MARLAMFAGFVLAIAGAFGNHFGLKLGTSAALCLAGLAACFVAASLSRSRGYHKASIDSDGNFLEAKDGGDHGSRNGGYGGDGGH